MLNVIFFLPMKNCQYHPDSFFVLQIEVGPGVNMSFINNTATMSGGGLHVTFPAIRYTIALFNRLCFLQYNDFTAIDVPPHQWQVKSGGPMRECYYICTFFRFHPL